MNKNPHKASRFKTSKNSLARCAYSFVFQTVWKWWIKVLTLHFLWSNLYIRNRWTIQYKNKRLILTSLTSKLVRVRENKRPSFSPVRFNIQYITSLIRLKADDALIPPCSHEILSHSGNIIIMAILRASAGTRSTFLKKGMWLQKESHNPGSLNTASSYWCQVAVEWR